MPQLPPLFFVLRMGRSIGERQGLAFWRCAGCLFCLHGFRPPFLLHFGSDIFKAKRCTMGDALKIQEPQQVMLVQAMLAGVQLEQRQS